MKQRVAKYIAVVLMLLPFAACDEVLNPKHRSKITMGTMALLATAIQAYRADHRGYPEARLGSIASLSAPLRTYFVADLPVRDAFGSELQYVSNGASFIMWSLGADQRFDAHSPGGPVDAPNDDIIISDSNETFWQGPKGLCCIGVSSKNPIADLRRANPELFAGSFSAKRGGQLGVGPDFGPPSDTPTSTFFAWAEAGQLETLGRTRNRLGRT